MSFMINLIYRLYLDKLIIILTQFKTKVDGWFYATLTEISRDYSLMGKKNLKSLFN